MAQKRPRGVVRLGASLSWAGSHLQDVSSLRALLSLYNLELDLIALRKGLEARLVDGAEVHKHIRTALARNEAEPLRVVEPLHCACDACHGTVPLPLRGETVELIGGRNALALTPTIGKRELAPRRTLRDKKTRAFVYDRMRERLRSSNSTNPDYAAPAM